MRRSCSHSHTSPYPPWNPNKAIGRPGVHPRLTCYSRFSREYLSWGGALKSSGITVLGMSLSRRFSPLTGLKVANPTEYREQGAEKRR